MNWEVRYAEDVELYHLTTYPVAETHPTVTDQSGPLDQRPEWLLLILNVAAMGEHFLNVVDPPPVRVLWFQIDEHCQLVAFDETRC